MKHKQPSEREWKIKQLKDDLKHSKNVFNNQLKGTNKQLSKANKENMELLLELNKIRTWYSSILKPYKIEIKTLKDQNIFLKDTNRELGRHETKRVKKIKSEQRKKVKWLKEILLRESEYFKNKMYLEKKKVLSTIDKAFKEER